MKLVRSLILSVVMLLVFAYRINVGAEDLNKTRETGVGKNGFADVEFPIWFKESFLELSEDIDQAKAENREVLLFFHQNGCPYCNAFVENNFSQRDISKHVQQYFDVIELNIWGDREVVNLENQVVTEKEFAKSLKIQFTPTLLFLQDGGEPRLRLNGYVSPEKFRRALSYITDKSAVVTSFHDYLSKFQQKANGVVVDYGHNTRPLPLSFAEPSINDKPILVIFEQQQCQECINLQERIVNDSQLNELVSQFDLIRLDMWADTPAVIMDEKQLTSRQWSRKLEIQYTPTLLFLDSNGVEVARAESNLKKFHTSSLMTYTISKAYLDEPQFQKYLSIRADRLRAKGIKVDLWN